jgi:hypothetical protein
MDKLIIGDVLKKSLVKIGNLRNMRKIYLRNAIKFLRTLYFIGR